MSRSSLLLAALLLGACAPGERVSDAADGATTPGEEATSVIPYFPPPGDWEIRDPAFQGMDPDRLREAVEFALAHEAQTPIDLRGFLEGRFGGLAHQEIVGPMKDRGPMAGLVLRNGFIGAQRSNRHAV